MIKEVTEKLGKRIDLTEAETRAVFEEIMSGRAAHADIVAFLDALREKGETVTEITAAAKVMREKSVRIDAGDGIVVDTCGTGGTGINTFNISTAAAFVAAGCGVKVAKHGNRSASCQCGSADVLEALGVKINISPEDAARCIKELGIGFMFAPLYHSAMKFAASARKELGGKTVFNLLGPLSNPAGARYQVFGVYDAKLTEVLASVLDNLGAERAFIACGDDGLDEITITGKTKISQLKDGAIKTFFVSPGELGIKKAVIHDIAGGDARSNADMVIAVLEGEKGPRRDIVLMNASAALVVASKTTDLRQGIGLAAESIDSGKAFNKLKELIRFTGQ